MVRQPYDFDFPFHGLEFVIGGDEFGIALLGESGGEGIGEGQRTGGLVNSRGFRLLPVNGLDGERPVGGQLPRHFETRLSLAFFHTIEHLGPVDSGDQQGAVSGIRTMKETVLARAEAGAAIMVSSHLLDLIDDLCSHLLILHRGQSLFQGTIAEAKSRLETVGTDASLEDIFFQFTESSTPRESGAADQSTVESHHP